MIVEQVHVRLNVNLCVYVRDRERERGGEHHRVINTQSSSIDTCSPALIEYCVCAHRESTVSVKEFKHERGRESASNTDSMR